MIAYETPVISYSKSVEVIRYINSSATFEETYVGENQIILKFNYLDQNSYDIIKNALN